MAYTRHNWVCGEVINDSKMNNIEDGIEAALECCENVDVGYECVSNPTVITSETLTPEPF